ncbi:MAG: hypothetical protein WCC17_06415 [Candidatus Nitrosopolaris sp.]|jgi:hypothetical protein
MAARSQVGRRVIEEYAYSDSEDVPDLLKGSSDLDENEIQSASTEELACLVNDDGDPLDYGDIPTEESVLASTSILESIIVDEEAMRFFLVRCIDGHLRNNLIISKYFNSFRWFCFYKLLQLVDKVLC